jgi:PPIC-type PPIASE domain/SurA N-terminal domain
MGNACLAVAAAVLIGVMGGCGGSSDEVVARVGGTPITKQTLEHWTRVVRKGGGFTVIHGEPQEGTASHGALYLLIAFEWLREEAAREGLAVSQKMIDEVVRERSQGQAGVEFRKSLAETGQNLAGYEVELRAELALEAIRRALARRINQITSSEIAAFYRGNRTRFDATPESRIVDIIEQLPSASAAAALVRRLGTGAGFAARAYHKKIVLTPGVLSGPATKRAVDYAIFAARPGVVSRPMRYLAGWTVFVVRRIVPARLRPLAEVRQSVVADLLTYRKRTVTNAFEQQYKERWSAKTTCMAGYVVRGCVEYRGPASPYESVFAES